MRRRIRQPAAAGDPPAPSVRERNAEFNRRAAAAARLGLRYGLGPEELEGFMGEWLERHAVLAAQVVDADDGSGRKAVVMLPTYVAGPTVLPVDHGSPFRRALRYARVFGEMAGWVAGGLVLVGLAVVTLKALLAA